jgi:tetratricopeptide (TPR) repeat protein
MRAFIIRPFGTKEQIDFEEVEKKLIHPALESMKIYGRTTVEIMQAGNIREDMFNRLLTADVVIADISLHNPNVFYELGIRHAFRDKFTVLLRSDSSTVPFDLQTDRYLKYDREHPEMSVEALKTTLRQTINSEKPDSPVFKYLPQLKPEDSSLFLSVPREFLEAVERAKSKKLRGDLLLLAAEAEGFVWEIEGLREVGRAQLAINSRTGALKTWQTIQRQIPNDLEANMMLSTIYMREKDYPESIQALNRVLRLDGLSKEKLSEVYELEGRNLKEQWLESWRADPDLERRRKQALRSPLLGQAYEAYENSLYYDLNNHEAGLNALSLLMIETSLANLLPDTWGQLHGDEDDEKGERELKKSLRLIGQLTAAVEMALKADRWLLKRKGGKSFDLESVEAGFYCITPKKSAEKITQAYVEALKMAPPAADLAMRDALKVYEDLDLFADSVKAALEAFNKELSDSGTRRLSDESQRQRILLFAGHRVDKDSTTRRFPPDKSEQAKAKIREKVEKELEKEGQILFGMAGGANGGDILFHEVCEELSIKTKLYLPTAANRFVGTYVDVAGADWANRFWKQYERAQRGGDLHILQDLSTTDELPRWLQEKAGYDSRRRNYLWVLNHALSLSKDRKDITLLVLWDGKTSTGRGDIADLVNLAEENGITTVCIYTKEILDNLPAA